MMTVQEVADRYGVSTDFMVRALARIGYAAAKPEQTLSASTVARFDKEWGDKIRATRPAPDPPFSGQTNTALAPSVRQPKPHVMRMAHAKVTAGRDSAGNRVKRLVDHPGVVHAIDAVGTNDGDPWSGEVVPGAVHFYDGPINSGPPAACGAVHMRAVLSDEFVPADAPGRANQCPGCAAIVAAGNGFRNSPQEHGYRSSFCDAYLSVRVDGTVRVKDCCLRGFHDGAHRAQDGSKWDVGFDDYTPSPDEVGSLVTEAT